DEDRPRLMRFGMVAGKQPGGQGAGVGADLDLLAIHSGGQGVGEDVSGPASAPGTTDVAAGHGADLARDRARPGIVFDYVSDHRMTGTLVEVEAVGSGNRRLRIGRQLDAHIRREPVDLQNVEFFGRILRDHYPTGEV